MQTHAASSADDPECGDPFRSHWAALLLPVALPAASDGWTWRKRPHWQRYSIDAEDELTDEEQASEGEDFDH